MTPIQAIDELERIITAFGWDYSMDEDRRGLCIWLNRHTYDVRHDGTRFFLKRNGVMVMSSKQDAHGFLREASEAELLFCHDKRSARHKRC